MLKRGMDLVIGGLTLIVLMPLLTAIAAAIYLFDGRPAFYRQVRVGRHGRVFTIFKFRTMPPEAEKDIGPVWSIHDDPRPSALGALLRRTGFDELPQLINILKGEMSLVGPRPERPDFVRIFQKKYRNYDLRHSVRPGLTGYAQVHGWRGATGLDQRTRHDLHYVRFYSPALDLRILLLTLIRGWSERTRNGVDR